MDGAGDDSKIIMQGWLLKRGEYIRNWRKRWFQLRDNGSFRGYKVGPPPPGEVPINFFDVAGSTLTIVDDGKPKGSKGKKYGFMIRFMQLYRFVERSFHLETEEERNEWITAYRKVQESVAKAAEAAIKDAPGGAAAGGAGGDGSAAAGGAEKRVVTIDDFDMMKVLGKGTFGKVMLGKDKLDGTLYAIKILKKDVILAKDEVAHTMTENAVLQSTNHPFLTGLRYSFQTKDLLCFVMDYVNGGELFFHLSREKVFTEDRARFYHGIIYRDLKLENLLLDGKGHIKITDFGLCKEEITFGATTTTFCGTPEYLAPEVLMDNDYGRAVDWWGTGVVMYEMMCGHLPFFNRNHEVLFELILHEEIRLPSNLSAASKDLLTKLLTKEPMERIGGGEGDGAEIMAHGFFAPIDFKKLYNLEIPPPFVPKISGKDDVSNFDPVFTNEEAKLSPPDQDALVSPEEVKDEVFQDFTSVATRGE
eukprot:UC1_evm1s1906